MLGQKLSSGDAQAFARAWNFGPHDEDVMTVRQLAETMVAYWGACTLQFTEDGGGPDEALYLKLDCTRARSQLGWRPLLSTIQAVQWTADWYRSHLRDPSTALGMTVSQIERYTELGA